MGCTIFAGCPVSFFAGLTVKKPNIIVVSKKKNGNFNRYLKKMLTLKISCSLNLSLFREGQYCLLWLYSSCLQADGQNVQPFLSFSIPEWSLDACTDENFWNSLEKMIFQMSIDSNREKEAVRSCKPPNNNSLP